MAKHFLNFLWNSYLRQSWNSRAWHANSCVSIKAILIPYVIKWTRRGIYVT